MFAPIGRYHLVADVICFPKNTLAREARYHAKADGDTTTYFSVGQMSNRYEDGEKNVLVKSAVLILKKSQTFSVGRFQSVCS